MSSSLISGSGSTSSGGVLYSANNAVQTPTSTENTITLENEIFYTGIPVVTSYPSNNGSVTLYTSPVLVSSSEETISIPTLLQEHHRDYYKGESFRYSPEWRQNYHYRHDEYITDFISITPTTLLYCKNSHLSAIRPELIYDSEGNVTGVDSDDWGISITVRDGRTLTWDDYTEEQKQELIDDVLDSFNYSCIYVGSGRIYGESEVPTVFPYSPIEYAQVNDVYINTQNSGLYTCVTPGEPDEAEWIYQGSIKGAEGPEGKVGPRGPKGDTGNRGEIWVTGTELTGTSINNKTIRGAQKGDLYLNSETSLVYRCTRDEIDASIVGTELLNESFATIVSNQPLTDYDYGGTITYQDEYINYVTSSSNTKGMSEALSGGTRPEVLFAKNSIIDIEDIPTAGATSLLLSFKSNNYSRVEVPDTDYYIVSPGEGEGQYILELSDIYSYITITLENNTNSNARIDDIIVNVKSSGENTPQVWEYVTSLIATPSVSGMTIVELSSPTGELTDEQFELVSSDHCIVKYNGYYYFKTYQSPEGGDYSRLTTSKTDNAITSYYFTFDTEFKGWTFGSTTDNRQRLYPNATIPAGETPETLTTIGIGSTKYIFPQAPDEVFVAVYGTTSFSDVTNAYNANKEIIVPYNNYILRFSGKIGNNYYFSIASGAQNITYAILYPDNSWQWGGTVALQQYKLKTSWSSSPSDSNYPSEKLVYDSLGGKQDIINSSNKLDYNYLYNTPDEVEANPTVPSGTTPTELSGVKIGSSYYTVATGGGTVVDVTVGGASVVTNGIAVIPEVESLSYNEIDTIIEEAEQWGS